MTVANETIKSVTITENLAKAIKAIYKGAEVNPVVELAHFGKGRYKLYVSDASIEPTDVDLSSLFDADKLFLEGTELKGVFTINTNDITPAKTSAVAVAWA